jgi:hypothetical protein
MGQVVRLPWLRLPGMVPKLRKPYTIQAAFLG